MYSIVNGSAYADSGRMLEHIPGLQDLILFWANDVSVIHVSRCKVTRGTLSGKHVLTLIWMIMTGGSFKIVSNWAVLTLVILYYIAGGVLVSHCTRCVQQISCKLVRRMLELVLSCCCPLSIIQLVGAVCIQYLYQIW